MTRLTTALSSLAVCAAVLAYAVTHLGFPSIGFEGALVFGSMSLWLAAIAAGLAVVLLVSSFLRRRLVPKWPLIGAAIAIVVIFVTVRF
jgi:hypothetical protein